jgi:Domain of unknown function (DUF397)
MGESSRAQWRKSSRSASGEQCVEIYHTHECVLARDSKTPSGPTLACSHTEWTTFLDAIKNGKLHLCYFSGSRFNGEYL